MRTLAIPRQLARLGVVLLVCHPGAAFAQTAEISPFAGYRFGGGFYERLTNRPIDMDGAPAVGAVLNIAMRDGLWFEGLFTHQEARVDVPAGPYAPPARLRMTVDQWFAGGRQEIGATTTVRPFVTGLLGLTRHAADTDSEIRFAIGAGGGVTLQPTRHLAARLDGRVFTTFADFNGRVVACAPGRCLVTFNADIVWQAEFTAGLTIIF